MLVYEVGKPLPYPNLQPPGHETVKAVLNSAFFDVVCWIGTNEREQSIETWRNAPLVVGVFAGLPNEPPTPFFMVDFPADRWEFEVSLNVHSIPGEVAESWLNSPANVVTLMLVDAHTNIVLALRTLGLQPQVASALRDAMERQDNELPDREAADAAIQDATNRFTTEQLLLRATARQPFAKR